MKFRNSSLIQTRVIRGKYIPVQPWPMTLTIDLFITLMNEIHIVRFKTVYCQIYVSLITQMSMVQFTGQICVQICFTENNFDPNQYCFLTSCLCITPHSTKTFIHFGIGQLVLQSRSQARVVQKHVS